MRRFSQAFCALALISIVSIAARAQPAPAYTDGGELIRPTDYRGWVFLTSGLDMFYGELARAGARPSVFDNVFVTREAYAHFMRTGTWPDRTMFVLELRSAESGVSIDNAGRTQGAVVAIEAAVKDLERFSESNGWGYFTFDSAEGLLDAAPALPTTAACYACHATHTAVDNTFVQFYPTLLEVAERFGTVKATYDPARKAIPAP